jgi:hypothetical protein
LPALRADLEQHLLDSPLEFSSWLEEVISSPTEDTSSLLPTLALFSLLRPGRTIELLHERLISLELGVARQHSAALLDGISRVERFAAEFQEALWTTEIEYVRRLIGEIERT